MTQATAMLWQRDEKMSGTAFCGWYLARQVAEHGTGCVVTGADIRWARVMFVNGLDDDPHRMFSVAEMGKIFSSMDQQIDRRRRDLIRYGWVVSNYKDDRNLTSDQLRVDKVGEYVWHPGWRADKGTSQDIRDRVFRRDQWRCQSCRAWARGPATAASTASNGKDVRLTVGRILPGSLGGAYVAENCRAECSECNEQARDTYFPRIVAGAGL